MYISLFSTPLYKFQLNDPKLNQDIINVLEELKENNKGFKGDEKLQRSFVKNKGWRSDWLDYEVPCFKKLLQLSVNCLTEAHPGWKCNWEASSWAVMSEKGDYHLTHCHNYNDWSSVYYVSSGDEVEGPSGDLEFIDPRGSIVETGRTNPQALELYEQMLGHSSYHLTPVDGLLVFFPSWLLHSVVPYLGDRPRIAIATNYKLSHVEKL